MELTDEQKKWASKKKQGASPERLRDSAGSFLQIEPEYFGAINNLSVEYRLIAPVKRLLV